MRRRVKGFDWQSSFAWNYLVRAYGPKLKQEELVSIADLISRRADIKVDRDARRRKVVMIKWFDDNWHLIHPLLRLVVLDPD